jgi:serine/threonine protein kinase
LHVEKIFHLDIKPENVVMVDGSYKICDFGSAIEKEIVVQDLSKKEKSEFI